MSKIRIENIFVAGPIPSSLIAESIGKHSTKTSIGAHSIFLGQVRSDCIDNKRVTGIDYSTFEAMALNKMHQIREEIFAAFPLSCMQVYHSLGRWRQRVKSACMYLPLRLIVKQQ